VKSERFKFAEERQTVGQKLYSLTREALGQFIHLVQGMLNTNHLPEQVLQVLMPA
jgi:hypothetical protein